MTEYRLFTGEIPHVSTAAFHEHRERAPHLEQPVHRPRLDKAAEMILDAARQLPHRATVSDLGCGDGGLLSLLQATGAVDCWGYDFQPSNREGWLLRGVRAYALDVFGADRARVDLGHIAVCTEVLEHVADPHGVVRWIGGRSRFLVASSPWNESPASHDECHCWAWDQDGYRALIEQGGYQVIRHETVGQFQIVLGEQR
jgi:hypothetical protein